MIEIEKRGIISAGLALMMSGIANAEVTITQGKTLIPDGEANHVKDLTVQNEKLAFALAIESAAPWGVPRGALVDLSVVTNGRIEGDKIAFADFIPNSWSAWPNDGKVVTSHYFYAWGTLKDSIAGARFSLMKDTLSV